MVDYLILKIESIYECVSSERVVSERVNKYLGVWFVRLSLK